MRIADTRFVEMKIVSVKNVAKFIQCSRNKGARFRRRNEADVVDERFPDAEGKGALQVQADVRPRVPLRCWTDLHPCASSEERKERGERGGEKGEGGEGGEGRSGRKGRRRRERRERRRV